MTSPECRSHCRTVILGVREHALELAKVILDVGAALGQINQKILGCGKERLLEIAHNQHLRVIVLTSIAGNAEVVERAVDCHESKPCPAIGVRYPVQALQNASRSSRQKSTRHTREAHVEQEEVDQGLGSPDHVLLRSNKLAH
jgi:hypothetical protein